MGLKYYLNLFKKDSNSEAVKLRYLLGIFVFLVYMVLLAAFIAMRTTDAVLSSVFGLLAVCVLILHNYLSSDFARLIGRLIEQEPLDASDEIDAAFLKYRQGYADFMARLKPLERKFFVVKIISTFLNLAFFPAVIVTNLLGYTALADTIFRVTVLTMIGYFILFVIFSMFTGEKGVWYQAFTDELAVINRYKSGSLGVRTRYKILEDKKQDRQMEYLFPQEAFKKKFKSLYKLSMLFLGPFCAILVAWAVVVPYILAKFPDNETLLGNGFAVITALWLVFAVVINFLQDKLIKKQYLALQADPVGQNALHIKLHEMRTPFRKRWNILFLVCFFGNIISNIVFAAVTVALTKNEDTALIFLLLFFVEIVATFVVYFKAFGALRLKMMAVEDEIDRLNAETDEDETAFNIDALGESGTDGDTRDK